jgi:hypothetical protein
MLFRPEAHFMRRNCIGQDGNEPFEQAIPKRGNFKWNGPFRCCRMARCQTLSGLPERYL